MRQGPFYVQHPQYDVAAFDLPLPAGMRGFLALPFDAVWEDIVQFLASKNIQIKNIAKDSGIIYAEASRFDNDVADCGSPGILHIVGRRATFNVFVNRSSSNPTVSVNTEFTEVRRFDGPTMTVPCNSRGVLEAAILNAIKS